MAGQSRHQQSGSTAGAGLETRPNAGWLSRTDPALFRRIRCLPWVKDGLTGTERRMADLLLPAAGESAEATYLLVSMPIVQRPGPGSLEALTAFKNHLNHRPELAAAIFRHSRINGAITPDNALLIAATLPPAALGNNATALEILDQPDHQIRERRIGINCHSIRLAVISPGEPPRNTMIQDEQVLRNAADFMQTPPPLTAAVIYHSPTPLSLNEAENHSAPILLNPTDEAPQPHCPGYRLRTLTHEMAHYWWRSNRPWLDEVICDTIAETFAASRHNRPLQATRYADYAAGQRLMMEIRRAAGPLAFAAGLRNIYLENDANRHTAGLRELIKQFPKQGDTIRNAFATGAFAPPPTGVPEWRHHQSGITFIPAHGFVSATDGHEAVPESPPSAEERNPPPRMLRFSAGNAGEPTAFTATHYGPDHFPYRSITFAIHPAGKPAYITQAASIGPEPGRPWTPGTHRTIISAPDQPNLAQYAFEVR